MNDLSTEMQIMIASQIALQTMALLSTYMMGSKSPRKRMQGFILLALGNIPAAYVAYKSNLYVNLMMVPMWVYLSLRGLGNCIKVMKEEQLCQTTTNSSESNSDDFSSSTGSEAETLDTSTS